MKNKVWNILILSLVIAIFSSSIGALTVYFLVNKSSESILVDNKKYFDDDYFPIVQHLSNTQKTDRILSNEKFDFVLASQKSTSSVVFIQTLNEYEFRTGGWLDWFFEPRSSQQTSSGSGVILSSDGYIITNNHVIDDADIIRVIHNKKSYTADLIGKDPSSDLAVIKINDVKNQLPAIELVNSSNVNVGEWVLAVGNPFNLTSTVTAGIVSAKGRNINILRDKFPLESFIQTDAAINPGNSGGALVNMEGKLVGINTAILSRTGSYTGYGFAIPSNIVKKVFEDIKNFGEVQKTFTGADFVDIDSDLAKKMELSDLSGVMIVSTSKNGAAEKAKIKKGDVVKEIDGNEINSKAGLEEYMANLYPGDKINLVIERGGEIINKSIILTNREGGTGVIRRELVESETLEATFETVSKVEKDLLGIENGVKVVDYKNSGFFAKLGIPEGFIITKINNILVEKPDQLTEIFERLSGRVVISGVDNRGRKVYYPYFF